MSQTTGSLLILVAVAVSLAGCKSTQPRETADDAAARVNGIEIKQSEVDRLVEQQLRTNAQQGQVSPTPAELALTRLQILEGLVTQEALYQRAERLALLPTDEEVVQGVQQYKRDRGLSEEGFQRALREVGQTEDQFKRDIRRQLAIKKLFDREVTPRVTVTDREIEEFYNNNKAQFVQRRGFALARIIVNPEKDNLPDDAVGPEAAERKIKEIYDQLRKGADFATVAANRSEDPLTSGRGGNWQFFAENSQDLPEPLRVKLMAMNEGDFTEPLKIGNVWWILKVTRRVQRDRDLTLDEVRSQIAEELRNQREQVLQSVVTRLALSESKVQNSLAQRMLDNPVNFGNLRPISIPAASSAAPQPSPAGQPTQGGEKR